jgi:hypothetical protein
MSIKNIVQLLVALFLLSGCLLDEEDPAPKIDYDELVGCWELPEPETYPCASNTCKSCHSVCFGSDMSFAFVTLSITWSNAIENTGKVQILKNDPDYNIKINQRKHYYSREPEGELESPIHFRVKQLKDNAIDAYSDYGRGEYRLTRRDNSIGCDPRYITWPLEE